VAGIYRSSIPWNQNVGSQNKYYVRLVHCNCSVQSLMTCCWILCTWERIFILRFILTILCTNCNTLLNHQLAEVTFSGICMSIWIISDRHFHLVPDLPSNSDSKMSVRGELHFYRRKDDLWIWMTWTCIPSSLLLLFLFTTENEIHCSTFMYTECVCFSIIKINV